jgi:RNA polymerase sigma factor (sigma-70 family)
MGNRLHAYVWREAHTLFREGVAGDLADEELLRRFVDGREDAECAEMAFEALVRRHGAMVFRVCRTILRDRHDAEDAFQATFLVLARQAGSIRNRASLASWLHGVARRVACYARLAAARRRRHERQAASPAERFETERRRDDAAEVVHAEIDHLPEKYRDVVVLCDMEGLTEGQAARRLGRPLGTIRSRLSRGRQRLRSRLIRRGLAPASVALALAHATSTEAHAIAPSLLRSAVSSACHLTLKGATTAGIISASAAALAEGFLGRLLVVKIQNLSMTALLALGVIAAGALAQPTGEKKAHSAADAKQEIRALMDAWAEAMIACDVGTMDRLLAYELIGTDPTGCLWDKAKYLEHIKTNAFHVASIEFKETRIDVYGDAAVETGVVSSKVTTARPPHTNGPGYITARLTRTWIKRHGTWQFVAYQTMVIASGDVATSARGTQEIPGSPVFAGASTQAGAPVVSRGSAQPGAPAVIDATRGTHAEHSAPPRQR